MAFADNEIVQSISRYADTDLLAKRIVAMKGGSIGEVIYCSTSAFPFGITNDGASADEAVPIVMSGLKKVTAGGVVTLGQKVSVVGVEGKVQNSSGTDRYAVGIACESGTLNQEVLILFFPMDLSNSTAQNNIIYVDKLGNDTSGLGTIADPFATPQKAVDTIIANADCAAANPYVVILGAGVFTHATPANPAITLEDGITGALLANIHFVGQGKEVTRLTSTGGVAVQSTATNDDIANLSFSGIGFVKGVTITGASAASGITATEGLFFNCDFETTSPIILTNVNRATFRDCGVQPEAITLVNVFEFTIEGGSSTGAVAVTSNSGANQPSLMLANDVNVNLEGCTMTADPTLTLTVGGDVINVNLRNGARLGTTTIALGATAVLNIFDGLIVGALTGTGTVNVQNGKIIGNIAATLTLTGSPLIIGEQNIIYVDLNGNDTTGNGSAEKPLATGMAAITRIIALETAAVSGLPYVVKVGVGTYTDLWVLENALLLDITFVGEGEGLTTLTPAGAVSVRSQALNDTLVNLAFYGITFGKDILLTGAGALTNFMTRGIFRNCRFLADADMAVVNANQLIIDDCGVLLGDITMGNVATVQVINSHPDAVFTPTADSTANEPFTMAADTMNVAFINCIFDIDPTPGASVGAGVVAMVIDHCIAGNAGMDTPVQCTLTVNSSQLTGDYTSTGVVVMNDTSVTGNVVSAAGTFAMNGGRVTGNVTTGVGIITFNNTPVSGNITTTGAGNFIGNNCLVGGSLLSTTGAITIVNGEIAVNVVTGAGAITLSNCPIVGNALATGAGDIVGVNCPIGGNVESTAGAVTISGNVAGTATSVAGILTINGTVGGLVTSGAAAVNINGAIYGGIVTGVGIVTVNGVIVGNINFVGAGNVVQPTGYLGGIYAGAGGGVYVPPNRVHFNLSAAGDAQPNTLFVDVADNLLKYRDAGNILRVVTVV